MRESSYRSLRVLLQRKEKVGGQFGHNSKKNLTP